MFYMVMHERKKADVSLGRCFKFLQFCLLMQQVL